MQIFPTTWIFTLNIAQKSIYRSRGIDMIINQGSAFTGLSWMLRAKLIHIYLMFTTHTGTSSPIKPLLLYASIKIIKYICKLYVFSNIKLSMYSHIFQFNIFFNIHTSINQKNKFIHDTWVNLNHISDVFNKIYTSGMNMCTYCIPIKMRGMNTCV